MSLLNVNGMVSSDGSRIKLQESGTDASSRLNSVMTELKADKPTENTNKADRYLQDGNYDIFSKSLSKSRLNSNFLSESDLLKKGFVKSDVMDMNGGVYYINKKTGEGFRMQEHRIFGDGKSITFTNNNMSHFATYDKNGKETGGVLQIRQQNGGIKVYNYDVDIDGNRFIKSVEINNDENFAQYE